jgi:hypothetical protein
MEHIHSLHFELRHATKPTYVVSYLFPLLFVTYEAYRVSYWIARYGMHFANFKQTGYDFLLMLVMFGVQILAEALFLVIASSSRHADLGRRLANVSLGLFCSLVVLAFDYLLQIAF